jgi:AhpD family alkylhydroperoxidase
MTQRLDYQRISPEGIKGLFGGHAHMTAAVPRPLLDILWLRVSQINGCAYCVDLHSREAREHGASDRKLHHVATWWESPLFDDKERAALAYAEAVTRLEQQRVADETYEPLKALFDDRAIVELTIAIASMNAWNRMAVAMKRGAPA